MKILILSDDFPPEHQGGAGIIAYRIAKQFIELGHSVSVVCAGTVQSVAGSQSGMSVHCLRSHYPDRLRAYLSLYNPQIVPPLKRILAQINPDVVFAHNIHQHLSYHSLKLARGRGIPVFLTCHDVMPFAYGKLTSFVNFQETTAPRSFNYRLSPFISLKQQRLRYFPLRNILIRTYLKKHVCRLISVSDELRKALEANGIGNVTTIHNGIDPSSMQVVQSHTERFVQQYRLEKKKCILFGGRISYLKGAVQLLRAIRLVAEQIPESALIVAGPESRYATDLKKLAADLGIENHIVFTGWIDSNLLKAAYAASRVVVTPSIYLDPFPTINLEAMAASRPVIATCFGGSREVVTDGQTGYIVNPLNTEALAERIMDILTNDEKGRLMGEAGYKRVQELFSLERCAYRYMALLAHETKIADAS